MAIHPAVLEVLLLFALLAVDILVAGFALVLLWLLLLGYVGWVNGPPRWGGGGTGTGTGTGI